MSYVDCIKAIKDASGDTLTDDEIADLVDRVMKLRDAKRQADMQLSMPEATKAAAAEISDQERLAAAIEKRNALLNLQARQARRARYQAAPNLVDGIRAEIRGINTPIKGGRFSAEAEGKGLQRMYIDGVVTELEQNGLLQMVARGDMEREWSSELFELSKGIDGHPRITGNEQAYEIAQIMHRWQSLAKQDGNKAGAWIGDYAGYITHTSHDADKIRRAGFDAWYDAIMPKLDRAKTFEGVDDPKKMMQGVYNAFITGVHLTQDGLQGFKDPAFKGPGNMAKRLSQSRVLHFQDAATWLDYHAQFGRGTVLDNIMRNLELSARRTGLMRHFGTNPEAELDADLTYLKQENRDRDPDAVNKITSAENILKAEMGYLSGKLNMPVNRLGAQVGSTLRVIESMAKLGGVALTHASSAVTKAAELRYQGVNLLESYGDFLTSMVRGRGAHGSETRNVMDLLGAGLEGMQRDMLSRFQPDDTIPGTLSKIANTFFKYTGITYLVNAQRAGTEFVMSRHLGRMLDMEHGSLPPETQRILGMFGIDAPRWDMLRSVADHATIEDRKFLTPDAGLRADPAAVEAYLRATGRIKPEQPLLPGVEPEPEVVRANADRTARMVDDFRNDLAMRLYAYFNDRSEYSVIVPGVAEKAMMLRGTRPGTVEGEAMRFFAQFKTWPAALVTRALGREVYGGQGVPGAVSGILHMALGALIVGYLVTAAKDYAKGRNPRDPRDPATWAAAEMQGGGLGIFGDYLFGQYDRMGHSLTESLAGPVVGAASDLFNLWNEAKGYAIGSLEGGKPKDVRPDALRFAENNLPFVNLFYVRLALDHLFLFQLQEAMSPGYLRRYEQRIQKQNHQTFWLRPSAAVH